MFGYWMTSNCFVAFTASSIILYCLFSSKLSGSKRWAILFRNELIFFNLFCMAIKRRFPFQNLQNVDECWQTDKQIFAERLPFLSKLPFIPIDERPVFFGQRQIQLFLFFDKN